mgnify:FL=1
MTDYQKLYSGISKAAWGYFFLYFNINFNNVSILPSFVGYLLFLSAINLPKEEERELSLLHTLGVIMALWTGVEWLASFVGLNLDGMWQFIDIIISLVNLYFHFQFLTNLASIAVKYQSEGNELDAKLLRYRTLQTVMLTAIEVIIRFQPWLSEAWTVISICMLIVYLIAGICLMKALFDLRKCLPTNKIEA